MSDDLNRCSCGNGFYPDTVAGYLEYKGIDSSLYDGTLCFECAFRELTGYYPDEEDADGMPDGCRECGGDYPNCRSSCNLFDE